MKKKPVSEISKLAGRMYDVSDYQKNDQLSAGLATTHEQVSDAYVEGELKPNVQDSQKK